MGDEKGVLEKWSVNKNQCGQVFGLRGQNSASPRIRKDPDSLIFWRIRNREFGHILKQSELWTMGK